MGGDFVLACLAPAWSLEGWFCSSQSYRWELPTRPQLLREARHHRGDRRQRHPARYSRADVIVGLGGRDEINGLGGVDRLCGQVVRTLFRGVQAATSYLGAKPDQLSGGDGNDLLDGNTGYDQLNGDLGTDVASYSYGANQGLGVDQPKDLQWEARQVLKRILKPVLSLGYRECDRYPVRR